MFLPDRSRERIVNPNSKEAEKKEEETQEQRIGKQEENQ